MLIPHYHRAQEDEGKDLNAAIQQQNPHLNCGQRGRSLSRNAQRQEMHERSKHARTLDSCRNTYCPIIERGRGLDLALSLTLFQDRLMRHRIAPADQISPFWPSLPGLGKICKCSAQPVYHAVPVAKQPLFFISLCINKTRGH